MERFKTIRQFKNKLKRLEKSQKIEKKLVKEDSLYTGKIIGLASAVLIGMFYLIRG